MTRCIFCEIVAGREPASVIYEDDCLMAFMTLKPTRPGESLIIPKAHIDHFTDIDDNLVAHMMIVAQRIGRKTLQVFQSERIGYVVHGYGVAHAHLIIVPQQDPEDITSRQYMKIQEDRIVNVFNDLPAEDRAVLDKYAKLLKITLV